MLSRQVLYSDKFMSLTAQQKNLYIYLALETDDDGMINAQNVMRSIRARKKDIETLVESGLLIKFESGIYALTHFHVMNTIRKDMYKPTIFASEHSLLEMTKSGLYIKRSDDVSVTANNTNKEKKIIKEVKEDNKEMAAEHERFDITQDQGYQEYLKEHPEVLYTEYLNIKRQG